jgi:phospholipid transport system substrate-binding protein
VNSKVVTTKGEEYSLNYRVQLIGNEWKVYDVVAENISLVNNYRSQFNRVIAKSSYEEWCAASRTKTNSPAHQKNRRRQVSKIVRKDRHGH